MQLSSMKIRYFRCFDELEINFQTRDPKAEKTSPMDGLTVLVGRNGEGKTAVLDAINIAWNPFFWRLPVVEKNGFKKSDRPSRPSETEEGMYNPGMPNVETVFETDLPFKYQPLRDIQPKVSIVSEREAYFSNNKLRTRTKGELSEVGEFLIKKGDRPSDVYAPQTKEGDRERRIWPLLAYYGDGRLWGDESRDSKQHKEKRETINSENAYDGATNPNSGFKEFTRWFVYSTQVRENKRGVANQNRINFFTTLDNVLQSALCEVLKPVGWTKIGCDENDKIIAFHEENFSVEVTHLSSGTRVVLGLVADIVFRCCKLNRRLRENVLKETPGIVLIDEIELHLHPKWQQEILPILCKIFPRIQFIVTTHSPQVVSSVPSECVRILDQGKVLPSLYTTEGKRAEQVLNDVFGTESRAENEISEKLCKYRELINDDKWDSEECASIERFLYDRIGDDPELAELEMEIHLRKNRRRRPQ